MNETVPVGVPLLPLTVVLNVTEAPINAGAVKVLWAFATEESSRNHAQVRVREFE